MILQLITTEAEYTTESVNHNFIMGVAQWTIKIVKVK